MSENTAEPALLSPRPELPDDTPLDRVRFSKRIKNALGIAGLKTVGEVRESSDATLLIRVTRQ